MKDTPNLSSGKKDRSVLVPRLRKYTHTDRLKVAHHISDRVVRKYGNDVLAIFICGLTSKNLDRPFFRP
jgi:hypothetical protein